MRKILFGVAGAIAALVLIACGTGSGPTVSSGGEAARPAASTLQNRGGPRGFKVGEHATLTLANGAAADMIVESVKLQGKSFVAKITIKCTAGMIDYNPFSWKMFDGDGTALDDDLNIDVPNQLHSGTLGAGQSVTGAIVWVGAGHKLPGARVSYSDSFTGDLAYWTVP